MLARSTARRVSQLAAMLSRISSSLEHTRVAAASSLLILALVLSAAAGEALHGADGQLATMTEANESAESAASLLPRNLLSSDEINDAGDRDLLLILQKRVPNVIGAGNIGPTNANIAAPMTLGGSTVRINGLPTLVLYEGRRLADAAALAMGGAEFTDIGVFPTSLLSRVDVVKGGISALYGS